MRQLLGLKYRDGLVPNVLVIVYIVCGYVGGLYLMITGSWAQFAFAVVWFGHALVLAAYLIHECAHNTIFAKNERNAALGRVLTWVVGACYSDYAKIRDKHFRHHVDQADVIAIDFRPIVTRHPVALKVIYFFEWFYIPLFDWIMHFSSILVPFLMPSRAPYRTSVVVVAMIRFSLFGGLLWLSPRAALGYFIGYSLALHVLRFMDAFQHTFAVSTLLDGERPPVKKDRAYEQANTFSNPLSVKIPLINWLTLNFGFHNAHHEKPNEPWYRLPRLHRELFGDPQYQVLPFCNQVKAYHRFRLRRILNEDPPGLDIMATRGENFVGVVGVSFLTAF